MTNHTDTERFLQAIFPDYGTSAVFANLHPHVRTRDFTQLDPLRDCYWSVAAFPADGSAERTLARALEVRALVVDDVGTKVLPVAIEMALGEPTAVVETSAGNYQWTYRLATAVPVADWATFFAAIEILVGHKLEGRDAVHLFRLPMGINTKTGRGSFAVRLVEINPGKTLGPVNHGGITAGPGPSPAGSGGAADTLGLEELRGLMKLIPNDLALDRGAWVEIGHELKALCEEEEEGWEVFNEWSSTWEGGGYDEGYTRSKWDSFGAGRLLTKGVGLKARAEGLDPGGFAAWKQGGASEAFDDEEDLSVVAAAAWTLDISVDQEKSSIAIVKHLAGRIRKVGRDDWREFDETTGRWREWTGDHMMRVMLELVNERKKKPMDAEVAKKLQSIKFIQGIAWAAGLHKSVMAKVTDFDRAPLLLGVPSGVIDLRKGASRAVRRGRASEMVSKAMWVDPAPAGTLHPEWSRFLAEFTGGDAGLEEWLQVHAGYCLTGLMEQHILPYFHGSGGNGKSVYLNALRSIWGEYGTQMDHRLLFEKTGSYHLSPLAVLAGVRLAVVTDVPSDATWDVHIMKMLTGDDAITANRMHQDPITFKSTAKVTVSGNTEPVVKDMDDGIRRRLKSLPLTVVPKVVDIRLSQKLAAEYGAILNWALTGLDMYWGLGDLPVSKTIQDATDAYHTMLDPLQRWLDTGVEKDTSPGAKVSAADLFRSWDAFRCNDGRFSMSPNSSARLARKMVEKGFMFGSTDGRSYLRGYKLTKSFAADVF